MSDETTSTGGWSTTGTPGAPPQSTDQPAGFCQNCGRPLTQSTLRTTAAGVFCEPCAIARTSTPGYPPIVSASEPSPALAGLLGFIPGAGAFYNGQYAKGIAHFVIFAILVSLASDVNGIFGLFVGFWELYMAFEAYHTAKARRDGLPLPNPFGFNDLGERTGFTRNWAGGATVPVAVPGTPPPPVTPSAYPGYVGDISASQGPTANWVGYIPPTAFASAPPQMPPGGSPYYSQSPYSQTYAGDPYTAVPPVAAVPPIVAPYPPTKRFPVGAFWLIGLGAIILLANLVPDWRISARWWLPVLFAGLSVWTFTRRMRPGVNLVCIIRWPIVLMVLAIMFGLHAADFHITFGLTVSVLLILFGGLLLLERTAGAMIVGTPTPGPYSFVPPNDPTADAQAPRAVWPAETDTTKSDSDTPKGGY